MHKFLFYEESFRSSKIHCIIFIKYLTKIFINWSFWPLVVVLVLTRIKSIYIGLTLLIQTHSRFVISSKDVSKWILHKLTVKRGFAGNRLRRRIGILPRHSGSLSPHHLGPPLPRLSFIRNDLRLCAFFHHQANSNHVVEKLQERRLLLHLPGVVIAFKLG